MSSALTFDPIRLPEACQILRREARAFLAEEIAKGTFDPNNPRRAEESSHAKEFAKRVAAKGWIGMTWPKKYGGRERSFLERYVLTEEFRVANAPTRIYFTADRQSGPTIIRYGTEKIKQDILPRIVKGEISFCIGMSEPGSGSDLFAAKTRATKVDGGYLINGTKIWTSNAHQSDYMIGLFRTSQPTKENRRHGLTNFVVDMKTKGITCNQIRQMSGQREFNEVVFQDAFVPDDYVLGEIDGAWKQATTELSYERSGPERFLETYYVLTELVRALGPKPDSARRRGRRAPGGAAAHPAAHVGVGRRHAGGRQGAGGGILDRQGHRHAVGAGSAVQGADAVGLHRAGARQPAAAGQEASPTPPRWRRS